tara:strand:- start:1519 stop:2493 length:975 start_codon:yes stop_codon:yes gene_type:complete
MKVREAINDLKKGTLSSVYFLKGNDLFLQSFFIEMIAKTFFKTDKIDKTLMLPDDMKGKEIIDRITASDLFSSKKLFILRSPQQLKGKSSNDLFQYCLNPIENHILIMVNDDWISKSSFLTKIEKVTSQVDVQTPFKDEMKKWANYFFKKHNKSANDHVQNIIVEMAGDSVAHLNNEIEKICILYFKKTNIEPDDVKLFSGWKRERQRWEFLLALGSKDIQKSIFLGKTLIMGNETMISLIYPLTSMFQEMLFVKMKNGTFTQTHSYTPIPPSVKKRIPSYARGFSKEKLELALVCLGKIDKRQKTAFTSDETELLQFIGLVLG